MAVDTADAFTAQNIVTTPPQTLSEVARATGTTFILALFVTLSGKPCAKLVPIEAVEQLQDDGVGFAGYAAGHMGQEPKDSDLVAVPDVSSFTPIPFVKPGLAIVHCDPHVEGKPWPYAPRVILKETLKKASDLGLSVNVGAEIEYFLVHRVGDGALTTADTADVSRQPCYDARDVTRMYDHLTEVSAAMNTLGWGNYANDHEDGNGQFEQNFDYADAMTTADRVITARYLLSVIAEKRGMKATFMPKPFSDRTGSGMHLHLSLWNDAGSVFPDGDDPKGLGLSRTAYAFIAGILEHACALQGVIAPTVNSYKRTGATSTSSGATWSPRYATYGGNDRTHYLRVPDKNRVELRGGDGSANPYLAAATAIAAGLDGIERDLDPGTPGSGDSPSDMLPMTLLHAMDALESDPVVTGALDVAGPGVAEYFATLKREEFFAWHNTVSPWELDHYLTAF
ncbi:glutamine synthetase [Rhodococcus percolatus]|uniref:type III glutamate--ammonia ligase n=1 Tax=Rhodococcus TaxID=1827 RepID=UPI0010641F42|nr:MULTISPECIES: type III glutamate--ammonia ligase [Rhodococcus]MBA8961839.1 glutamine synthetase [Rhodococcus opacus]MBP2202297.1 glutamine synthetase [Rhodococcus opacus]MDI9939832.1 type III glutamate--ammonia ligase [Rhodococcus sp. IEGM 1351]